MRPKTKNLISMVSKPIAFILALSSIWLVFVAIPGNLFQLYRIWRFGEVGGQSSIYFMALYYYFGSLSFGFSVFVAIRVIQNIRKNFSVLRGFILPPYTENPLTNDPLPKEPITNQKGTKKRLRIAILAFVVPYFIIVLIYNTILFDLVSIGQYIQSVSNSNNLLVGIFESLLVIPSDYLIDSSTQGMNPESLAGNLFLLWIPATIHIIGFANISGLVYDIQRRGVCRLMIFLSMVAQRVLP